MKYKGTLTSDPIFGRRGCGDDHVGVCNAV